MPQSNSPGALDLLTNLFGLWDGLVVDIDDPLNLGRVRVKVSGVHDLRESETPWNKVDWAEPCFAPGTFRPPIVGDTVWVMFRQGSVDHPVYMGVKYSIYESQHVRGRIPSRTEPVTKPSDDRVAIQEPFKKFSANNTRTWWEPEGNNAPRETWFKKKDIPPEIYMIERSPRGHTFYVEDTPTREKVVLIDRSGMMFKMSAGVIESSGDEPINDYNMARRLDQNAEQGTQFPLSKIYGNTATILLIDLSKQKLEFTATSLSEEEAPDGNRVLLSGVGGFVRIRERGGRNNGGSSKGEIRIETSQRAIQIMDYGFSLTDNNEHIGGKNDTFDMHDGKGLWDHQKKITIKVDPSSRIVMEPESILIRSGTINIAADGDVNISAGGNVNVTGTKINLN